MWVRCKRAFLFLFAVGLMCGSAWSGIRVASAQEISPWLTDDAPTLSKIVDLSNSVPPENNSTHCSPYAYVPEVGKDTETVCLFTSPLGVLTSDGRIKVGDNNFAPLMGPSQSDRFMPAPFASYALMSVASPQIGNYIGLYRHLTISDMRKLMGPNGTFYDVPYLPDDMLVNPLTREPLQVAANGMTYSANSRWAVVNVPGRGLLRIDMLDLSVQLFAAPIEPVWYLGVATPALAISDDGRYVAANTDIFGTGNITLYDLTTCTDQLNVKKADAQYCKGKNIWNGQTLAGVRMGAGMREQWPGIGYPTRIQFVNNDSITFSAIYDQDTNTGRYKAAIFTAVAPGSVRHMLGLLGMGDSFISGQGEFVYRQGTDTDENGCHLSELSYPFLLGSQYFDSSNSVACSGAKTSDIVGTSPKYSGQTKDKVHTPEEYKPPILANFLPGYIYQQEFASTYRPEAILLSIGGNDVHFSDILKSCVANAGGGTCYDTYEQRVELLNEVNRAYPKLVNTYKTLREQSGGARVYVVGYPQVAKPDGNCGLNVHLNHDEVIFSSQLITYLDGIVHKAAETAGVFYVDTEHAFDGHRLCEPGTPAMNGLTAGNDVGVKIKDRAINVLGNESYHPTQLGHQLIAAVVAQQTNGLSAEMPAPTAYQIPNIDQNDPLLQGVPKLNRPVVWTTHDNTITDDAMAHGNIQQVNVNGSEAQLQPRSRYQVVLHSNPILLDEGGVDASGNIMTNVHIPADVEPGFHMLHVYGVNMSGQVVDIQKVVYIAASEDDFDGDGVPNSANMCLVVGASGQDMDQDGIDDACDGEIGPVKTENTSHTGVTRPTTAQVTANSPTVTSQAIATSGDMQPQTAPIDVATGQVLGSATEPSKQNPQGRSASVATSPSAQQLFRLNWMIVLEVGLGWTVGGTVLYYAFHCQ